MKYDQFLEFSCAMLVAATIATLFAGLFPLIGVILGLLCLRLFLDHLS